MNRYYNIVGVNTRNVGYRIMSDGLLKGMPADVEHHDDAKAVVFCMTPNMVKGWRDDQIAACFTMWETDRLPADFGRFSPAFNKLLVPSTFCAELFDSIHPDISVVPLGVDLDKWRPAAGPKGRFRFLTAGSLWKRKGLRLVIDAFLAANLPDAELVVKTPGVVFDDPGINDFGPNVILVREELSADDEVALHRSADCFVSGSCGEGFGLIPMQHLALGNIVILPDHTGHRDFAHLADYRISSKKAPASIPIFSDYGNWWEPDLDELVDAMRAAHSKGRLHLATKRKRAKQVADWTWENSVLRLLEVFPPMGLSTSPRRDVDLMATVVAIRNVEADIGAYRIRAKKGDVFSVPACTVAQLVESGVVTERNGRAEEEDAEARNR